MNRSQNTTTLPHSACSTETQTEFTEHVEVTHPLGIGVWNLCQSSMVTSAGHGNPSSPFAYWARQSCAVWESTTINASYLCSYCVHKPSPPLRIRSKIISRNTTNVLKTQHFSKKNQNFHVLQEICNMAHHTLNMKGLTL